MPEYGLERLLAEALQAQAAAAVSDHAIAPAPRFADSAEPTRQPARTGRVVRWLAPIAAAAAVVGVVFSVVAVGHSQHRPVAAGSITPAISQTASSKATASSTTVHVRLLNDDGATYGVGMPVIAYFSRQITNGRSLQRATVATVDGEKVSGAWFFEPSAAGHGPIEAHFRLRNYWPAHARIQVSMPISGLSAGGDLTYANNLAIKFSTSAKHVATVDAATHLLTLQTPGQPDVHYPVSVGAASSPTRTGTKVIMEQKQALTVTTSTGKALPLQYAQRLTYGGEYLCGAAWNVKDIDDHINSSGGSTTLLPTDAKKLFALLQIGDIIKYTSSAGGTPMQVSSGYGDWNDTWITWLKGGSTPTH